MIAEDHQWKLQANCREANPELFFPSKSLHSPERKKIVRQALRYCRACPVLENCRRAAIEANEQFGIWGAVDLNSRGGKERIRTQLATVSPLRSQDRKQDEEQSA